MSRKTILPSFILTVTVLFIVLYGMETLQPALLNIPRIFGFGELYEKAAANIFAYRVWWIIGDMTEPYFYKSVLPSLFLVSFGFIGYYLDQKGKPFMQIPVLGGTGLFIPVFFTSTLALILTNIVFFDLSAGWVPTFAPFASTAPALVLMFGKTPKKLVTTIIIAGLAPYPSAYFLMVKVAQPLGVPDFCGVAIGMGISTALCIELCRLLPWMNVPEIASQKPVSPVSPPIGAKFFFARLLHDPGELVFWGSGLSTIGLILGAGISFLLNPLSISYGTEKLPILMFSTFATLALAIFIWYPKYVEEGFVFTFASAVCTAAVVTTYKPTLLVVSTTILFSAFILPGVIRLLLRHVTVLSRWHPCCTALVSIGVVTMVWSYIVMRMLALFA